MALSWGGHVTVVRPKALAVRLREMALDVRRRYTSTGAAKPNASPGGKGPEAWANNHIKTNIAH